MTIKSAEYLISSARVDQCPIHHSTEYAFIGRSNVGKSSLINMITGHGRLAKTSAMPGKTMLINHFVINKQWYLVDLPGYGFAKRSKKAQQELEEMISAYIMQRTVMTRLFVLLDVRHDPQRIDMEFLTWLRQNGIPFSIVFTKADKLARNKANGNVLRYTHFLAKQWGEMPHYFVTSAQSKQGRDDILAYIERTNVERADQLKLFDDK